MTKIFLIAAALATMVAGANAADMAMTPAPAAQTQVNWSGWYAGATVGGAVQNTMIDDKNCDLSCSSQNRNGSGITMGGTLGWNYQLGSLLLGIEGDFNWADFRAANLVDPNWSNFGSVHSSSWDWFSTVRGRIGVTAGRALIFATGGVAFVDSKVTGSGYTSTCTNTSDGCFDVSGVRTGIAAGVGFEYALSGPWSLKAEYLYVGLPSKQAQDQIGTTTSEIYFAKSDAHILRFGLNYNLNGLPSERVAGAAAGFYKAPAMASGSWSGWYLGAVAGGALQNTILDDKNCNLSCSSLNRDGSGFTAGGTAGWNYQFGSGLVGIEGDFNWAGFRAPDLLDPDWSNGSGRGTIHSTRWNWFSTVRGRAGLVVDRALFYATGGVAFVDMNSSAFNLNGCSSDGGCWTMSGVQPGIAAGAGVEYALSGPWTAKAEYLYVGVPTKTTQDLVRTNTSSIYNVTSDAHILRVGLNYHGNEIGSTPAAPAAAGWSGWYVGGVAGGALENTILDDKTCDLSCSSQNLSAVGATAGGTVGWNYVAGAGLFGIEGDFSWTGFRQTMIDPSWPSVHSANWNWLATIRGRAGLVVDRTLVYVTGGLAFVDLNASASGSSDAWSVNGVQPGIAAGVGAEFLLTGPWSAKAEYLYVTLPAQYANDTGNGKITSSDVFGAKSDAHILRVGLDYHLN